MPGWNEAQWFSMLAGVAFKSTLVLGAAGIIAFLLRRRSAAVRHVAWTGAAAAVLALPLLSGLLPALQVTAPGALTQWNTGLLFRSAASAAPPEGVSTESLAVAPAASPAGTAWHLNLRLVLMTVWCAGTMVILIQMLAAYAAMSRARRRASEFPDVAAAREAAARIGLPHPVRVLQAGPGSMPMTFGLRRPAVFLPADAVEWSAESRRMVLLHELAHIRRGDAATHLLARAALSFNWWNPLAWMAWREFLKERERAADDLVLAAGAHASAYASRLLEVARSLQSGPATAWAAIAMARRSQMEGRLLAILDAGVNRKQAGRTAVAVASVLAIVLVAPFAAMRAQTDAPTAPPEIDATIRAANGQKNHEILERAASAYEKLRKYDAAQTLLESALAIRGQVDGENSAAYAAGLVKLGELASKRGKFAEAEGFYSRAVALGDRPEVVPALLFLGRRAFGSHNYESALDLFQRALNVDPSGPQAGRALTWMGEAKSNSGSSADAEAYFQRALAVEAPDSSAAAMTMDLYARFLRDQNRVGEAEQMEWRVQQIRKTLLAKLMPQSPASEAVYRAGGGVAAPALLSKVEPAYTEEARALKIQGTELLYVEIGPDGLARNYKVVRGLGFGLDEAGIEAVSQWRFKPGTKNGYPVTVAATIEINWRLM